MTPTSGSSVRATARFGGIRARGVVDVVDPSTQAGALRLAQGGTWFVQATFEGECAAWRMAEVGSDDGVPAASPWHGPAPEAWVTSLDAEEYRTGVRAIRSAVREGEVYQVNLCRVLAAPLDPAAPLGPVTAHAHDPQEPDAAALDARLAAGNPAPYGGHLHVPAGQSLPGGRPVPPAWVVPASPELFLALEDGHLSSAPIKGTAATPDGLTPKDEAENIMITDLVRNDLQRVCVPGTVSVEQLLAVEHHPGLVHLVTTVTGALTQGTRWDEILGATFPPASVSGAPKAAALRLIGELEPTPRGPYCGAFGWIDADAGRARLAVGIRTFWWADGALRFGTGAGITWGSDPEAEWRETQLKASILVGLASTPSPARGDVR
ncbi:chorismate-binding protein [Sanguibacter sp. A247]|uniref:chorismate-binding protein n=1 Tax=unclassified Sanguibacter TaxID=2645534 RepID=UPI003FD8E5AB